MISVNPCIQVGDHVTYADLNLSTYRGTIVARGRTTHGGDCTVAWTSPLAVTSEECLKNLCLRRREEP